MPPQSTLEVPQQTAPEVVQASHTELPQTNVSPNLTLALSASASVDQARLGQKQITREGFQTSKEFNQNISDVFKDYPLIEEL